MTSHTKWLKHFHFIIGLGIVLCSLSSVHAQQIPYYSQYTFSPFILNPAAAGADAFTTFILTNRNQWLGVEGAPTVFAASLQTRIMKKSHIFKNARIRRKNKPLLHSGRVGLGIHAYNYHAGQIDQTWLQFTYAYHIFLNSRSQLSLGLSLGFMKYKIKKDDLKLLDNLDDPAYGSNISLNIPDANFGVYYSDSKSYIGISILQLLQSTVNFGTYKSENFHIYRQFYLIGGYKYNLNTKDVLEPSFYIKSSEQLNFQLDVSVKYVHDKKLWFGLGYRSGMTLIGSFGVNINKLFVGYSFDYSLKALQNYSYGTHEIMLAIRWGDYVRRYRYLDRY